MSGAAILALGAAFCFALALILTQYGRRTVPSWRSPLWAAALVGRRTFAGGPADHAGVRWFLAVGRFNGTATFLLYAALGWARSPRSRRWSRCSR